MGKPHPYRQGPNRVNEKPHTRKDFSMSKEFDERERVKEMLRSNGALMRYADASLKRKGKSYVCPFCHSGEGPKGTPAFSMTARKGIDMFKCFSAKCGKSGDVFDLAGQVEGLSEFADKLEAVARFEGIDLPGMSERPATLQAKAERQQPKQPAAQVQQDYTEGRKREREYIAECRRRMIEQPNEAVDKYLAEHGMSRDRAIELGLGYDPKPKHGWIVDGRWVNGARLVIPWRGSTFYHTDRAIEERPIGHLKYDKPESEEVGPQPLYNLAAVDSDAFFIVEGIMDALAVEAMGYQAVALAGANISSDSEAGRELAEAYTSKGSNATAIVMLDADDPGRDGANQVVAALDKMGIPNTNATPADHEQVPKDAAEWLATDPDGLAARLASVYAAASAHAQELRDEQYFAALRELHVKYPSETLHELMSGTATRTPVPTGFYNLDEALGGGWVPGQLVIVGAVNSMGKTSFALQTADSVAAAGHPVVFCTIEQSVRELVAKSVARISAQTNSNRSHFEHQEVLDSLSRSAWTQLQETAFEVAASQYECTVAPYTVHIEGDDKPTVKGVRAVAERVANRCGVAPLVVVDYLQLLDTDGDFRDVRLAIDNNVKELRQMARDLAAPVIVISSLSRSGYTYGVNADSFKESGGIEYGADVLLGIEPRGMRSHMSKREWEYPDKVEAERFIARKKNESPMELDLYVLKNRAGRLPKDPVALDHHAECGLFVPAVV